MALKTKITFFLVNLIFFFTCPGFGQVEKGKASYYAQKFNGRTTASGEIFRVNKYTAAHKKLPFGTKVRVTNLHNNKSIIVRINDRGPYVQGRIIDLAPIVAEKLGFKHAGVADVLIEPVDPKTKITGKTFDYKSLKRQEFFDSKKLTPLELKKINSIYQLNALTKHTNGYGLLIGETKKERQVFKWVNSLSSYFPQSVQIRETHQHKYQVMVGHYNSLTEAEKIKEYLLPDYPHIKVVNYSKL